jgi:hypothetical protein
VRANILLRCLPAIGGFLTFPGFQIRWAFRLLVGLLKLWGCPCAGRSGLTIAILIVNLPLIALV